MRIKQGMTEKGYFKRRIDDNSNIELNWYSWYESQLGATHTGFLKTNIFSNRSKLNLNKPEQTIVSISFSVSFIGEN